MSGSFFYRTLFVHFLALWHQAHIRSKKLFLVFEALQGEVFDVFETMAFRVD